MLTPLAATEGSVSYAFSSRSEGIPTGEWRLSIGRATGVSIWQRDVGAYGISVRLDSSYDEATDLREAQVAANAVLGSMSLLAGLQISEPHLTGLSLPNPPGHPKAGLHRVGAILNVARARTQRIPPSASVDITAVLRCAELSTDGGREALLALRLALEQTDPIAEFMLLYNVMLQVAGDSQKAVDSAIRSIDPAVPLSPSPATRGVDETVYTRLRNEIAHARGGRDRTLTLREVEQRLSEFRSTVRSVVRRVHKL